MTGCDPNELPIERVVSHVVAKRPSTLVALDAPSFYKD